MKKHLAFLATVLLATLVGRPSFASVCVQVDTSQDTLSEGDRKASKALLEQALRDQGVQVDVQNCTETYRVYHIKLGNSITVFMQGPKGYRQATARSLEDVPAVYSQMVRSLISGRPMNTIDGTVDRTNVTSAQQAPNRVEADSLWYLRIGYGLALGPTTGHGVAFGFGYRYELDELGVDLSFLNLVIGNNNNSSKSTTVTGSWAKIMGLYFLSPIATGSLFLGGGLSWGMAAATGSTTDATGSTSTSSQTYTGSGLQGEISVGYEFLRASTIRMFLQADATLPFYTVRRYTFDSVSGLTASASSWVPSLAFSFGIGWGKSITRVHVVE